MRKFVKKYISSSTITKLKLCLPSFIFRKPSYSQCGEDLLVVFLLDLIHGSRPKRYLDIGANHPFKLSNTALLSSLGGQGVLVEPDPYFAKLLSKKRPKDTVIQGGVHFSGKPSADFFVMDSPTLNTFSAEEVKRYLSMGHKLRETLIVELLDINDILGSSGELDFLNIDIEGLDKSILEMIDWQKHRPTCICVETLTYETKNEPKKLNDIVELLVSKGYSLYADTYINSIFVDSHQWAMRWNKQ